MQMINEIQIDLIGPYPDEMHPKLVTFMENETRYVKKKYDLFDRINRLAINTFVRCKNHNILRPVGDDGFEISTRDYTIDFRYDPRLFKMVIKCNITDVELGNLAIFYHEGRIFDHRNPLILPRMHKFIDDVKELVKSLDLDIERNN